MRNYFLFIGSPPKTRRPDGAFERARKYAEAVPGAVSGQGGHNETFKLACRLTSLFALNESELIEILTEYNDRCAPPWSAKELKHKARDALLRAKTR